MESKPSPILLIICVIILMIAPNHGLHEFGAITLAAVILLNVVQIGYVRPIDNATNRALDAISHHVEDVVNDEYRSKEIQWEMVPRSEITKWMNCKIGSKQYRHITIFPINITENNLLLNTDVETDRCDDDSVPSQLSPFGSSERMLYEEKTKDTMETQDSRGKSKASLLADDKYVNLSELSP